MSAGTRHHEASESDSIDPGESRRENGPVGSLAPHRYQGYDPVDEKQPPRRRRATFLQWLCVLAIVAVCGAILYQQLVVAWQGGNAPAWYLAYLKWQKRHGLDWLPF